MGLLHGLMRYLRLLGSLGIYTLNRELAFRGNFLVKVSVEVIWLGILIAYDSADWISSGQGVPVSFCIVCVVFVFYMLASLPARYRSARATRQVAAHALTAH